MQFRPPICSSILPNKFFLNYVVKQCHSEVQSFTKEADKSLKEPKYFTEMRLYIKNMNSSNTQQKRFWAMRGNIASLISVQQRTELLSLMEPAKWVFLNCWIFNAMNHFESKMLLHKMISKALHFIYPSYKLCWKFWRKVNFI